MRQVTQPQLLLADDSRYTGRSAVVIISLPSFPDILSSRLEESKLSDRSQQHHSVPLPFSPSPGSSSSPLFSRTVADEPRYDRAYIKMLGGDGLTHSSKIAMLSANYAMARLSEHYRVKFTNEKGRCAHEFIIDLAEFDASAGLKVMDFAKRLQVGPFVLGSLRSALMVWDVAGLWNPSSYLLVAVVDCDARSSISLHSRPR